MNSLTGSVALCSLIRSLMRCHGPWISFPNQGTASHLLHGLSPTVTAAPPGPMHPVIPTAAFRPRANLTLPFPSPRDGDFSRQVKGEPTSGCDGENETPVDIAITITVERVVRHFPDSWGETINDDSLCPSGRHGPPAPSWFSYGFGSAILCLSCDLTFAVQLWPGPSTISIPSYASMPDITQWRCGALTKWPRASPMSPILCS